MLTELLYTYLPQNPLLNTLSIIGIMAVISIIAFYITEKIILNLLTIKKLLKLLRKPLVAKDLYI